MAEAYVDTDPAEGTRSRITQVVVRDDGESVGSSCNNVTALALNLGNAATGSKACGYFDYLEVMKSQQT